MTRKFLTISAALVAATLGLAPVGAAAAELHFVFADTFGDEASFNLASSPVPFSTSSSPSSATFQTSSAYFNVSNYVGTGILSTGTGIELGHFSEPYYGSTLAENTFGFVDGSTPIFSVINRNFIFSGSLDRPRFPLTSTIDISQGALGAPPPNYLTITAVPEPAAWALMLVGFGGLGGAVRTARRRAGAVTG